MNTVGAIAIGRNEGTRLRRCLDALLTRAPGAPIVYVDSGSTDGSVALAQSLGVTVVELDMSIPFTAARARNEGFAKLLGDHPELHYVQFLDGDCEIAEGWIDRAVSELDAHERVAVVCGRRRERFPEATIYNTLCDLEWNTPVGEARACGGDALIRVSAFRQVNGYNAAVIAGEEPEMCVRLRGAGWSIRRIDAEMTLHDAAMTRFGQWWKRNVRAGHAYAEGAHLHGRPPERHGVKAARSNWFWGLIVPAAIVALAVPAPWASAILALGYPLLAMRIYRGRRRAGMSPRHARLYAFFTVLGKFAQMSGQLKFWTRKLLGRQSTVIEYKRPEVAARSA